MLRQQVIITKYIKVRTLTRNPLKDLFHINDCLTLHYSAYSYLTNIWTLNIDMS